MAAAAVLANPEYGIDAAARELGVGVVIEKLKQYDPSGREDPIGDFIEYMGVDTSEEREDVQEEGRAAKSSEVQFYKGANRPLSEKSVEGFLKALAAMKELITEVEVADPTYGELRREASAVNKNIFEYAVSSFKVRGLTELLSVLAEQREETGEQNSRQNEGDDEGTQIQSEERKEEEGAGITAAATAAATGTSSLDNPEEDGTGTPTLTEFFDDLKDEAGRMTDENGDEVDEDGNGTDKIGDDSEKSKNAT